MYVDFSAGKPLTRIMVGYRMGFGITRWEGIDGMADYVGRLIGLVVDC